MKSKVTNVVRDGDRTLLYIEKHYYIIVGKDSIINVGDEIEYEPYGVNFGFLKE